MLLSVTKTKPGGLPWENEEDNNVMNTCLYRGIPTKDLDMKTIKNKYK